MANEREIPGKDRVNRAMLGIYETLVSIEAEGDLPSARRSAVRELIKILESGINRFDTEIDLGFGAKTNLQDLIERTITTLANEAESSRVAAGKDTDYAKKLENFAKNLKEVAYGDLDKNRTIH